MSSVELREVKLSEIAVDGELRYRDGLELCPAADSLRSSVRRCGVLQPVELQESAAGLIMVAGFRRLQLARELGLESLPARVASDQEDRFVLFRRAAEQHAGQPINLRERLQALQVGERLIVSDQRLIAELLPALGLAAEPHLLEDLRRLQALPPPLRDLLAGKAFSLRRCLPFTRLGAAEAELFAGLARRIGAGGRQIEEMLVSALEIAARDGVPEQAVLQELAVAPLEEALARLWTRRYPETSRRLQALELARARLQASSGATLRWDPALADDSLELSLRLGAAAELPRALEALGSAAARQELEAAFREIE